MDEEKYKPPFIDRFLDFIIHKYYYAFLITMIIGIVLIFFNRVAAVIIIGFCIILYLLLYSINDVYTRHKEKKIDREFKKDLDISKYFDNVKYDLYNEEDIEEFKKQ